MPRRNPRSPALSRAFSWELQSLVIGHPYVIARIRGRKGQAMRARVMTRDNGLCQPCKRSGRLTLALQADHIIALVNDGIDNEANMEAICVQCHRAKTALDLGYATKHGCDRKGMPAAPDHPWNR
jgi:hypothetical protein